MAVFLPHASIARVKSGSGEEEKPMNCLDSLEKHRGLFTTIAPYFLLGISVHLSACSHDWVSEMSISNKNGWSPNGQRTLGGRETTFPVLEALCVRSRRNLGPSVANHTDFCAHTSVVVVFN